MRFTLLISLVLATLGTIVLVDGTSHVPIQPPVALKESLSAPRSQSPPPSTALPLLEVPIAPEVRSAGLYTADEFPDQPAPRPNLNQEPLPLSPPGTYLHTAVLIDGKMYIYGGVASYEADKYFNDMWLFDFGAGEYVQLQGNYVPPPPNHAGLSTEEASAFAPHDVPAMPNMATAPRHENHAVEKLHPDANPISPFLPTRRAQRPVRVMPLEHIFAKDADKPTAAGVTMAQLFGTSKVAKPEFEVDEEQSRIQEQIKLERKRLADLEKQQSKLLGKNAPPAKKQDAPVKKSKASSSSSRFDKLRASKSEFLEQAKKQYVDAALKQIHADLLAAEARDLESRHHDDHDDDHHSFLEEHLDMSNTVHQRNHMRMVHRTIRAIEDARRRKNPATTQPFMRAGGAYADARHHRDGVAADYASIKDGRPLQDSATQQHHPNTQTPTSAPSNYREQVPHALQDFWQYDFDEHQWSLVGVNSSQPLAHSPWLTPAQLNDPVFKDPLPVLLPPTRRLHTAVVMKDRMIVFGGVSYNNLILGDLWIFDPEEASWIEASADGPGGSPILPREGHSAVTTKDGLTMLVFGGVSYGFLPFNDLWSYSAVDNAWYRLSSPKDQTAPMQRWLHTAVYHEPKDEMIIFGGITAHYVPLNDVHVYNVAEHTWRLQACLDTPPFPRMMHTAVTINDIMLISGGAANNLPMDDMYLLDLKTWRWKELIMTNGYPFARTGASAIVLSPRLRGAEKLELDDLSADSDDPHLQYKVDQAKVAGRPVVGSFSSEGLSSNEEQDGNMEGLDAIAYPQNPVVNGDGGAATQRPIYRYRKHVKNNYFFVLFGGSAATSAPQDQTHLVPDQDDGPRSSSFLEVGVDVDFSPDAVREHKSGQIGRMRSKRVRAQRMTNRHRTESSNTADPRQGEDPSQFGPYDERMAKEDAKPMSSELGQAMDAERKQRLGTVRAVGLARAPFCATYPWCQQTPPPPEMADLPPPENPEIIRQEMARLDPMKFLPIKLEELKKDPYRFGQVFQHIYETNKHNEKLANKMGGE